MAESTLTLDISPALRALAEYDNRLESVEKGYASLTQATKEHGRAAQQSLASGGDAARAEAQAIDRLQKEYQETAQSVQTLKRAVQGAYDPRAIATYTKAIADGEKAMRKLESAAEATGVDLKNLGKEAKSSGVGLSDLFGSITKVTVILAALNEVRKLASAGIDLEEKYQKAQKSFAAFLGSAERADQVLASLNKTAKDNFLPVEDVQQAGKALLAFGESADDLPVTLGRIADIAAATGKNFNELALIYGKARTSGVLYAEDINQLTDAGIPIIQEFAKQMGVSTSEVKKLASEGKIGFAELELAFANLTREGSAFAGQAQTAASETSKLSQAYDGLAKTIGGFLKPALDDFKRGLSEVLIAMTDLANSNSFTEFGNNFIHLFERINPVAGALGRKLRGLLGVETAQEQAAAAANAPDPGGDFRRAERAFEERQELEQRAEAERKKLAAASAKQQAAEAAARRKERERELAEREAHNRRLAELEIERLAPGSEERAIAQENLRFRTLSAEFKKFNLTTEEIEAQHLLNLFNIRQQFYQQRLDQQKNAEADELADLNDFFADRADAFASQRDAGDAAIDLADERAKAFLLRLRAQGASEKEIRETQAELDLVVQQARLRNAIEFQENMLLITDAGNTEQVNAIKAQIALLKQQLENVTFELENPEEGKKEFSIWRALGIDPDSDEGQRAIDSLRQSAETFKNVLNDLTAARVAAADAAVEQADRQVQSAESALDREIELAELGFSSNVDAARKKLEEAKKQRQVALEEQRRAQRAQLAVDSAQQASNIALSITNLYKTWSTLPFGVGLIAAAAQAASIFALIASVRARAKALSAPQEFREGGSGWLDESGFVHGRTHEQGGHRLEVEHGELLQVGDDGGRRRVSIVRRERVRDYFDLLDAANRNDKAAIFQHALAMSDMSHLPTIDGRGIARRFDTHGAASSPTTADGKQMGRLIEIQERMLGVMLSGKDAEQYSADGKTRRRGISTTKFLN